MKRIVSLIVALAVVLLALTSIATAGVPQLMHYQGHLTDESGPLDTTLSMTFTIYDDSTGPTVWWIETQPSVTVNNGLFNVLLGSVNPIMDTVFAGTQRWLGITVGDDPEISPRTRLVSVPYAYNSDMLDERNAGNQEGDIPVNNGVLNVNLNADYLDGFDSQMLMSPIKRVIRDTMWISMERTKEFSPSIDPSKSVVLLGQPIVGVGNGYSFQVWELTSSSITIHVYPAASALIIDYQIIEYR